MRMSLFSQRLNDRGYDVGFIAGWLGLLVAAIWAYYPGLDGPFVLDDFGSIAALGHRGGVVDWETFKAFVLGGTSGPTGRPVSLLTFLIDARNWPADAWSFKQTNVLIHCLNGAMIGLLTQQVLTLLRYDHRQVRWVVLTAAGIWLLHPFLVSTTLYVVQRMAQLSTLFTLAGIALYLHGRVLVPVNARRGYAWMTLSLVIFTALATLSKENGILLPLFAAVVEVTLIASQRESLGTLNRYWSAVFLALPTVVLISYLVSRGFRGDFFDIVPPREFSIYERALTQPRILFDYLQHWFIPKLYTTGVFQDHFIKSTGFFAPVTTFVSLVAHTAIIAVAIAKRSRWPLFAFAALFFYTGHLLESTVMNLELYFEHRNYLATGFLALPLLVALHNRVSERQFLLVGLLIGAMLCSFTRYSSSVWSSWPGMVEASAHKAPTSERAQAQYSVLLFNDGQHDESLRVLDQAIERIPGPNALLRVNRLVSLCQLNRLSSEDFAKESRQVASLPYDARMIRVYTALADAVVMDKCPAVDALQLANLFSEMLQVSHNADRDSIAYSQIQYLVGFSFAYAGRRDEAVAAFDKSLIGRPGASHAMQMAAVMASNDFGAEALRYSDIALAEIRDSETVIIDVSSVSETDIRTFQETVREDIKALQDADSVREER